MIDKYCYSFYDIGRGSVGQAYSGAICIQRAYEAEMPMGVVPSYSMDMQFTPLTSTYSCGILMLASKICTPSPVDSKNIIVQVE